MSPDQPPGPIDELHKQLRAALDQHLASLSNQYEEALAAARYELASEADQAIAARVEAVKSEWSAKLDAEIGIVRGEAEQRLAAELLKARSEVEREWAAKVEAEVLSARTETERRLLADSLKARAEAEQQWAAKLETEINNARVETERRLTAEAMKARMEAEQEAAESAARARQELEQTLAAERDKMAEAQARAEEEKQTLRAELTTLRERVSALEAERHSAQTELESERQRTAGELESHRRRLDAAQEQLRKTEAEVEAERRRAASERDEASREAASRLDALRVQSATEMDDLRRRLEEQIEAARREAREAAQRELEKQTAPSTAQVTERHSQLAGFDRLLTGIRAIDAARTLSEALDALLRHASAAASRGAIFLINGDKLKAWKSVGLPQLDSGFESALAGGGLLAHAIQTGEPVASNPSQPAPTFANVPSDRAALAVPIVVGGRPVALLYTDNVSAQEPESPAAWPEAVETLGRHTSAALALLTAVRTAQALGVTTHANGDNDEQSARRYARILVSEIKLYNEGAVRAGRERRDLLARLEPEIARARRLYEERVPALAARGQLFHQELVQTLADGDPALLGNP